MWQIYVFINVISFSLSRLTQKILLKDDDSDPVAYSIVFQLLTALVLFVFALSKGINFNGYENYIGNILLMAFLYAGANYCLFQAYKKSTASSVTLFFSTNLVWTILASLIFLNENLTIQKILGGCLIFSALMVLNIKHGIKKLSPGEIFALLSAIIFALAFVNDTIIIGSSTERDLPSYLFISFLLPNIPLAIFFPRAVLKVNTLFNFNKGSKMLVLAVLYSLGTLAIFTAYQNGGEASSIGPLGQLSTIITVILAIIFLKERENINLKILAAILATIGGIIISL